MEGLRLASGWRGAAGAEARAFRLQPQHSGSPVLLCGRRPAQGASAYPHAQTSDPGPASHTIKGSLGVPSPATRPLRPRVPGSHTSESPQRLRRSLGGQHQATSLSLTATGQKGGTLQPQLPLARARPTGW